MLELIFAMVEGYVAMWAAAYRSMMPTEAPIVNACFADVAG